MTELNLEDKLKLFLKRRRNLPKNHSDLSELGCKKASFITINDTFTVKLTIKYGFSLTLNDISSVELDLGLDLKDLSSEEDKIVLYFDLGSEIRSELETKIPLISSVHIHKDVLHIYTNKEDIKNSDIKMICELVNTEEYSINRQGEILIPLSSKEG